MVYLLPPAPSPRSYHVVPGVAALSTDLADGDVLPTLLGQNVTVSIADGVVSLISANPIQTPAKVIQVRQEGKGGHRRGGRGGTPTCRWRLWNAIALPCHLQGHRIAQLGFADNRMICMWSGRRGRMPRQSAAATRCSPCPPLACPLFSEG